MNYDIQTNAAYVAGSAIPAPTSTTANRVTWTFNMRARPNRTTPTQASFRLDIQGGYTTPPASNGVAQIIPPAGVPSSCILSVVASVGFVPRLSYSKTTDADPGTILAGYYIVHDGQSFNYIITLQNDGSSPISGVNVVDHLPAQTGANFVYQTGATLDGQPHEPDSVRERPERHAALE